MPRYVILRHEPPPHGGKPLHWDLMLEAGETLTTWALELEPAEGQAILAEQLPDHRMRYLDYEGPVSRDRGQVTKWDSGHFEWLVEETTQLEIHLRGGQLNCDVELRQQNGNRWLIHFGPNQEGG